MTDRPTAGCPECSGAEDLSRRAFVRKVTGAVVATGLLPAVPSPFARAADGAKQSGTAETSVKRFYESLTDDQKKTDLLPLRPPAAEQDQRQLGDHQADHRRVLQQGAAGPPRRDLPRRGQPRRLRAVQEADGRRRGRLRAVPRRRLRHARLGQVRVGADRPARHPPRRRRQRGRRRVRRADRSTATATATRRRACPATSSTTRRRRPTRSSRPSTASSARRPCSQGPARRRRSPSRARRGKFPGLAVGDLSRRPEGARRVGHQGDPRPLPRGRRRRRRSRSSRTAAASTGCTWPSTRASDLGNDHEWDIWRLEGPSFVWHFRGAPHVHAYVNIAKKA